MLILKKLLRKFANSKNYRKIVLESLILKNDIENRIFNDNRQFRYNRFLAFLREIIDFFKVGEYNYEQILFDLKIMLKNEFLKNGKRVEQKIYIVETSNNKQILGYQFFSNKDVALKYLYDEVRKENNKAEQEYLKMFNIDPFYPESKKDLMKEIAENHFINSKISIKLKEYPLII